MRHKPVQFNQPKPPNRGIISDDTVGILALVVLAVLWIPYRGWQYLRTGR